MQELTFFDLLRKAYETEKLRPQRIFNMDESGLNIVKKPGKILACKGHTQICMMIGAERGVNITVI